MVSHSRHIDGNKGGAITKEEKVNKEHLHNLHLHSNKDKKCCRRMGGLKINTIGEGLE
jgi:hypothetical protein